MDDQWTRLFDAVGDRFAVRERCRVSDSTLWRWTRGISRPPESQRAMVNAMCLEHGLAPIFGEEETTNASTK